MDIWQWVNQTERALNEAGHHRLAELVNDIPGAVANDRHHDVDSRVPEALALARGIGHSWLEIFIRHWNLQSHIVHRCNVAGFLAEAIDLLDFSHREENADCPQAICVVQDLAHCYGLLDGPGYFDERIAVLDETFAKIDAGWPCFYCLTTEYQDALFDMKRYEDALAFLLKQDQALLKAGMSDERNEIKLEIARAYLGLGDYQKALEHAKESRARSENDDFQQRRLLVIARAAFHAGQVETAVEHFVAFEKIAETPSLYPYWAAVAHVMGLGGDIPNDWKLHRHFQQMTETLIRHGAMRFAIEIGAKQVELALHRGAWHMAQRCLAGMREVAPRLRKPLDAPHIIAELAERVEIVKRQACTQPSDLPTPEQMVSQLTDDPEADLLRIEMAAQRHVDHEGLAVAVYQALEGLGHQEEGERLLRRFVAEHPDAREALFSLGEALLSAGKIRELRSVIAEISGEAAGEEVQLYSHWLLALSFEKEGDYDKAIEYLFRVLELRPTATNALRLLADLERKTGRLDASLDHWSALIDMDPENHNYHWDRMIVATLKEDWPLVRASARAVGFQLEGEGPIDDDFGLCAVQIANEYGDKKILYARRNSPVSARIIEVSHPSEPSHYQDVILVDPVDLHAGKADQPEGGEDRIALYPMIEILSQGCFHSYVLDGFHPGEGRLAQLKEVLESCNCRLQIQSGEDYRIETSEQVSLPGLYGYIAVPSDVPPLRVAELLLDFNAAVPYPLIWPELAKILDGDEEHQRQQAIADRYGI